MARKISYSRCKLLRKVMTKQSLFSHVNLMYNTQRVQWMCGSFPTSEPNKSWSTSQPVLPHWHSDSSFHRLWIVLNFPHGWASEIHEQAWKSLLGGETRNKEEKIHFFSSLHMSPSSWVAVFTRAYIFCVLYYMVQYVFVHQSDTSVFSKIQACTGFEPLTSAIPVQRFTS